MVSVIRKGQNCPGLENFLAELKKETFDKYDAVIIGEAYGLKPSELKRLVGKHGYFSMIFDFSYMNIDMKDGDEWFRGQNDWTVSELRQLIFDRQHVDDHNVHNECSFELQICWMFTFFD